MLKPRKTWHSVAVLGVAFVIGLFPRDSVVKTALVHGNEPHFVSGRNFDVLPPLEADASGVFAGHLTLEARTHINYPIYRADQGPCARSSL